MNSIAVQANRGRVLNATVETQERKDRIGGLRRSWEKPRDQAAVGDKSSFWMRRIPPKTRWSCNHVLHVNSEQTNRIKKSAQSFPLNIEREDDIGFGMAQNFADLLNFCPFAGNGIGHQMGVTSSS